MTKRQEMSAAQFMAELESDPESVARRRVLEDSVAKRSQQMALVLQPVLADLSDAGYKSANLNDLVERYAPLPQDVAKILRRWLSQISEPTVKEQIVRSLAASAERFPGTELVATF